jgi:hypothetical protein
LRTAVCWSNLFLLVLRLIEQIAVTFHIAVEAAYGLGSGTTHLRLSLQKTLFADGMLKVRLSSRNSLRRWWVFVRRIAWGYLARRGFGLKPLV